MPKAIRELLAKDGQVVYREKTTPRQTFMKRLYNLTPNWSDGIIPVLHQLIELDPTTVYAYTCNPAVTHISKHHGEGSFCGYRNMQMLCSYIIAEKFEGHEVFDGQVPSIFQIQDHIESAWDNGILSHCRIATGGIKGTRKFIGTPEVKCVLQCKRMYC